MRKALPFFLALMLAALWLPAQVVLEDFEGGTADLDWQAPDGTFNGAVLNPDTDGINPSEYAGSYTKSNETGFSLFWAVLDEPLDLTTNNRFTIQIYAPRPTAFLMKLEGPGGQAIERRKNIAVTENWIEYTFDFSGAADFDSLNRIILFFDPGVDTSSGTYLFDNLRAWPANECAGVEPSPDIVDDFECQRNATYGSPGFADIEVVANPDPSGINTSDSVGQYTDTGGAFHALVIDYEQPLDLAARSYICIKVWAPVAGNLLVKLEGGTSAPKEVPVPVSELNSWQEYCVDFSDQASANHRKIVFFFNAGVEPGDNDVYYIDDITRTTAPAPEPIEDFEDGASLTWTPLNGDQTAHGTFSVIDNPDPTGANTSENVGQYVRGSSQFSTLTATLPEGIDLTLNPQLNLQVWAPEGASSVTMQLVSPLSGASDVDADIETTGEWVTLNFNFSDFADITDFEQINLQFDPGTTETTTWYFDNLSQGLSTVDACEGVEPDSTIVDDFECQRNVTYTAGIDQLEVISNPDVTPANPSLRVGAYTDPLDEWSALVLDFGGPIDLSRNNQFNILIWSPKAVPLLFKLEGGTDAAIEIPATVTETEEWVKYQVDFSAHVGTDHPRLAIFFNAGTAAVEGDVYYIDNLRWTPAPYSEGCIINFEEDFFTVTDWQYFANGDFEDNPFMVVENPDPDAINMSSMVGLFEEASNGEIFAGMFTDLPAPIALPDDNKRLTAKIWMPVAGRVALKLEGGIDGALNSGDVFAEYTTPSAWQELTWDYSANANIANGNQYGRLTIIPNFDVVPAQAQNIYFDDIAIAGGDCAVTGVFNPVQVDRLRVYPNPTTDLLRIENPTSARIFRVVNPLGQAVRTLTVVGEAPVVEMDVNGLLPGLYILTAFDQNGQLVANSTFVKR